MDIKIFSAWRKRNIPIQIDSGDLLKNFRLSKEKINIIKQALKEFRYPFIFAIIWTCFNTYANYQSKGSFDFIRILNTFFATFFFISWGFSQYFRIKKQNKVEGSFETIENKTTEIINRLEIATTDLIGNISGGESIAYLQIYESGGSTFIHYGKYTLLGASVRICNLQEFDRLCRENNPTMPSTADTFYNIPTLLPNHGFSGPKFDIKNRERLDYNIFYTSRNGAFIQELRMLKVDNKWESATRISVQLGKELYREVSSHFPRDSSGEIDWNKKFD